jgi:hypothetical protein
MAKNFAQKCLWPTQTEIVEQKGVELQTQFKGRKKYSQSDLKKCKIKVQTLDDRIFRDFRDPLWKIPEQS